MPYVKSKYHKTPTSISLPPKIVRKLDRVARQNLFPSRSALILHYIMEGFKREKLFFDWLAETEEYKQEPIEPCPGCLVDANGKQVFVGEDWNIKVVQNV